MSVGRIALLVLVALVALGWVGFLYAVVDKSDLSNIETPVNGTANYTNISGRMQQFVGFYGRIVMEVRKETGQGSTLYNKTVTSGRLFFVKNGENPDWTYLTAAENNSNTDRNLSLTGYYVTGNHFVFNESRLSEVENSTCNRSANYLNTTDNYKSAILCDTIGCAGSPKYFFCVDIADKQSTQGFGQVQYEIIVPKTSAYNSYDIFYDLEG
jgi:hypothetical protein